MEHERTDVSMGVTQDVGRGAWLHGAGTGSAGHQRRGAYREAGGTDATASARGRAARRGLTALALASLVVLASAPARAARPPAAEAPASPAERVLGALGVPDCACAIDVGELERYRDLVAAAESAEEARRLATEPTRMARRALGAARRIAPWSRSLSRAHGELTAYEDRIARSETPAQAAQEFEELVRLAGNGVTVGGNSGRCHYDTVEIIAII
ncbi:MAG TPA: hypothetical protein VIN04_12455, partial [Myxococcota bacterium]